MQGILGVLVATGIPFLLFQSVGIARGLQSVALLAGRNVHVLGHGIFYHVALERHLLVGAVDVLEGEVHQAILVALAHVEEVVAVHTDVLHRDVVALAQGHVLAVAGLEELGPGAHHEEAARCSLDVVHRHILIVLRCVGAHLQPEHALGVAYLDVAEHDVAVVHAFTAKSQTTVHSAVFAVLDEHVVDGTVLRGLVCPCPLAALDSDGIIVHAHVASFHQHVVAHVDVDGIAAGGFDVTGGGEDGAAQEAHMVATVDVVGPEGTVLDAYILQGHVAGVGDVDEAWALGVLVGTLAVPCTTNPELLPIVAAVAVDGARAGDGETVAMVGIDEGGEVLAGLSLDACLQDGEIGDAVAALQFSPLLQIEVGLGLEEEGSALVGSGGDNDDSAAFLRRLVDDGLYGLGLDQRTVVLHTIVGDDILLAERIDIYFLCIAEPGIHPGAVGPKFSLCLLGFLLFLGCVCA